MKINKLHGLRPHYSINHGKAVLSRSQEQLVLGSLLGDACLTSRFQKSCRTGKSYPVRKLLFAHSAKHEEYVRLKSQVLPGGSAIYYRISGHGSKMASYSWCHTPTLEDVELLVFRDGRKAVNIDWVSRLNDEGLAWWYMDDGSYCRTTESVVFHTNGFSIAEVEILREALSIRRINSSIVMAGGKSHKGKRYPVLRLSKTDTLELLWRTYHIAPICMNYKFEPVVKEILDVA